MKPVTQDGRSTRWEKHRKERRRELLRSARAVIDTHGPDAPMDAIALGSGTAKTVYYRYFGDRRGLQTAMGEWAMYVIRRELEEASSEAPTPRESLRAMVWAFARLAEGSPSVYHFCDTAVAATADEAGRDFFEALTTLFFERLELPDHESLWAYGALGFIRTCTEKWLDFPADIDRFVDSVTTWVWDSHPRSADDEHLSAAEAPSTPGAAVAGTEPAGAADPAGASTPTPHRSPEEDA
ncbi:TetR/AcrR family transcriptional regulator [Brevibacterium litoralis]|uniref:TetR/AcrR family transcriptional regulator n=1 Tax=Brevibacterium litoralis TaxID=3138935 RepID=UPI0032EDCDD4